MKSRLAVLVIASVSVFVAGCGTMATAAGKKEEFGVYSGTKRSLENGSHTLLDVPLSLVADTLLLPITATRAALSKSAPEEKKTETAARPTAE